MEDNALCHMLQIGKDIESRQQHEWKWIVALAIHVGRGHRIADEIIYGEVSNPLSDFLRETSYQGTIYRYKYLTYNAAASIKNDSKKKEILDRCYILAHLREALKQEIAARNADKKARGK